MLERFVRPEFDRTDAAPYQHSMSCGLVPNLRMSGRWTRRTWGEGFIKTFHGLLPPEPGWKRSFLLAITSVKAGLKFPSLSRSARGENGYELIKGTPARAGRIGVPQLLFFCQNVNMARCKTTVYIDEELRRAAKIAAARSGKHEYEIFEEALRRHLGLATAVEQIWAGISPEQAPSEEDAARIAAEELAAVRSQRSTRRAS
jgi:hypothetical protein